MSTVLVVVVTVVAGLLAALGVASTLAHRRTGPAHLALAALLEAVLLVQAALAVTGLVTGRRLTETATFVGYLAGILLLPVAGVLWARSEDSRWAGTVLAVAAASVAAMAWRLMQLWQATGG